MRRIRSAGLFGLAVSTLALSCLPALAGDAPGPGAPGAGAVPPGQHRHHAGGHHRGRGGFLQLLMQLGLTPEQKSKIHAIITDARKDSQAIRADQKLDRREKSAKIRELQKTARRSILALLTPEQKEKLRSLRQERRERGDEHRERAGSNDEGKPQK